MNILLKKRLVLLWWTLFAASLCAQPQLQDNIPEYERLGLSLTEWNQVQEHKMPMEQVKSLLRDGISISEYFKQPWVGLNLTEAQWLANRRRGLSDDDMHGSSRKTSSGEWAVIQNLFVPGLHQWLRHDYLKASAMSGIAAASLGLYAVIPEKNNAASKGFGYPFPFLVILAADMVWSSVDIGLCVARECNPDAARFSMVTTSCGVLGLAYRTQF